MFLVHVQWLVLVYDYSQWSNHNFTGSMEEKIIFQISYPVNCYFIIVSDYDTSTESLLNILTTFIPIIDPDIYGFCSLGARFYKTDLQQHLGIGSAKYIAIGR